MNVFAVNYDLKSKEKPDYKDLIKELKKSPDWWHFLESTWLVKTAETPDQLFERIKEHVAVHLRDRVLIIEVRDNVQGWLPKKAWAWIHANVPSPDAALS